LETKNLIRQNFIRDDVGRNKAEVLAERYTELYDNISVSFVAKIDKRLANKEAELLKV
jgi:tRNA A37 threonylcarbamoyladenosine dehydratase